MLFGPKYGLQPPAEHHVYLAYIVGTPYIPNSTIYAPFMEGVIEHYLYGVK